MTSTKSTVVVADIAHFFKHSSRADNDSTNKIREQVLALVLNPPAGYCDDATYGPQWTEVGHKFRTFLQRLCPSYANASLVLKGGRGFHYDADVTFSEAGGSVLQTAKLEFKYGGTSINSLPQFLSLPVKGDTLFAVRYHEFYYDSWLPKYVATDAGLTIAAPDRAEYLRLVGSVTYACHPFFAQLKDREDTNKEAKDAVVNASITAYLTEHGASIDLARLSARFQDSQGGKHFALWSDGTFHYDRIADADLTGLSFDSIKNGNLLIVRAASGATYELLLRWRNHKGVLNPAWQIKMKR